MGNMGKTVGERQRALPSGNHIGLPLPTIWFILLLVFLTLISAPLSAQEQPPEPVSTITDDDVNTIAKRLYCPVCEHITLDTCGEAACIQWRNEIRLQLEAGMTEQQIRDDFVARFGDRVVGTPQDTTLRILSLMIPVVAIAAGLFFLWRFFANRQQQTIPLEDRESKSADSYRDLLEQDIAG